MKNRLPIIAFALISFNMLASPYYRFWRGHKQPQLSFTKFLNEINQTFIPATLKIGASKGLIAYLPVITKGKNTPDEVALVVYKNRKVFRQIFSTQEGKRYGRMHWDYFNRRNSKSLVPQQFNGEVQSEKAYDLLQSNSNWQKGNALYLFRKYNQRLSRATKSKIKKYLKSIQENFKDFDIQSHIVLVGKKGLFEYILFSNHQTLINFDIPIKGLKVLQKSVLDRNLPLKIGEGSNQQF